MKINVAGQELDEREIALWLARGRAVVGLTLMFAPGVLTQPWMGSRSAEVKAMARVAGVRDLVLGVGAITNLKEQNQDAEWLGMGAVCDGVDALVSLAAPGLPKRARVLSLGIAGLATGGLLLARQIADSRTRA
jgi:hypothetical protein